MIVLLENGEAYPMQNSEKTYGGTWKIAGEEVHLLKPDNSKLLSKLNQTVIC